MEFWLLFPKIKEKPAGVLLSVYRLYRGEKSFIDDWFLKQMCQVPWAKKSLLLEMNWGVVLNMSFQNMFLSRANNDLCDGNWFKIFRVVRANKTAQGNMTLPDTAELMKDWVRKSVSCRRGHICTWSRPLMPLTEAEIECHLWSPGRKCPGAFNYYSYNCISFFPKTLFYSPFAFESSSAHLTLHWIRKRYRSNRDRIYS